MLHGVAAMVPVLVHVFALLLVCIQVAHVTNLLRERLDAMAYNTCAGGGTHESLSEVYRCYAWGSACVREVSAPLN